MMREDRGQAILAYFKSPHDAQIASERLTHELDIEDVQIDDISQVPRSETTDHYTNPINGFDSHAHLVEGADPSSRDAGILLGADPAVSGLSGDQQLETIDTNRNILLTVVCQRDQVEAAVAIINQCGGKH